MSEMRKVVSVVARQPIMLNSRMVRGINQESLSLDEIRQCILQHAIVSEILPTGERLVLDFTNYDKVNFEAAEAAPVKEVKKEEPVPEVKPEVKNPPKEDIRPEKKEQEEKEEAPATENKKRK